jgi:hypothetical protein
LLGDGRPSVSGQPSTPKNYTRASTDLDQSTVVHQEPLEALGRLRATLRVVAETDDVVDRLRLEVGQHGVERDGVPVDVGEERDAHRVSGCAPDTRGGRSG